MHSIRLATIASLLVLAACGKSDWPSEEERTFEEGHAPTPYTTEQIRKGCPTGRVAVFRIEAAGGSVTTKRYRFLEPDELGVTIEASVDGPTPGSGQPPRKSRASWRELQSHASFPADSTVITEERVSTPAGTFDCLHYVVTSEENGRPVVKTYDFARTLPGMPIRMVAEYDGKQVMAKTLVSRNAE